MRRLGYETVDMLVERLADDSVPALRRASPSEMRARLAGPQPDRPEELTQILAQLERDVLPFMGRSEHPGYFAFIPFGGTWPGALGDFVASALNVYAGSWMESAGPSQVELEVLDWFKDWIDYPATAAGSLVSGGSAANMAALACAREAVAGSMAPDLVVYVSDQAHSSLARAARVLGFRPDQVRVLPVDDDLRLEPATVADAMDADLRAGLRPMLVSVSAGATNTGSVDPLDARRPLRRTRHLAARRRGLRRLRRADRARPHDSLRPRPRRLGDAAFEILPDYLRDAETTEAEVNFSDLGMQLSRSARSLQALVLAPLLRRRRVPRRDRPLPRHRRTRGGDDRPDTEPRAARAAVPRHRLLPPPLRRHGRRGRDRAPQRRTRTRG